MNFLSSLFFLVLFVLKITGHILWSWWLVCLPIIILVALVVVYVLIEAKDELDKQGWK